MRRTYSIHYISELNKTHDDQLEYVNVERNSPLAGILRAEVDAMIKWASKPERGRDKLTSLETITILAYIQGYSITQISKKLKCSRANISRAKKSALRKIANFPKDLGLITVMAEELGWETLRDYLADIL